jgi:hypothetical protein
MEYIHSIWSILPWDVPWDVGHGFFLGLTYLVICVLAVGLTYTAIQTKKNLDNPPH